MAGIQIILQLKPGMSRDWMISGKSCVEQAFFILHLKVFPSSPAWLASSLLCKSWWWESHSMRCWIICDCAVSLVWIWFQNSLFSHFPCFSLCYLSFWPLKGREKYSLDKSFLCFGKCYFRAGLCFFFWIWSLRYHQPTYAGVQEHANAMWGHAAALASKAESL